MIWKRSSMVCARNVTSSMMVGSGQKRISVPVRPRGAGPVSLSLVWILPPLAKSMKWCLPPRSISTSRRSESALTTEMPTPCRPPDTL